MAPMRRRARAIAFYLPQFHPIAENDKWWGTGFTEWTNTAKAKPLFPGHYQPHVPADLGFYDLRLPEARQAQADLASSHGIEAFCYYHYWFAGRRILERPFREVLESGRPDFPFCLCWANETWSGVWHGLANKVLVQQTYPGDDDHRRHFDSLLPAFTDRRYVRVDGKPVFVLYRPKNMPELERFTALWRDLAGRAGLPGLYLVGVETDNHRDWLPSTHGFDATILPTLPALRDRSSWRTPLRRTRRLLAQALLRATGRATGHSFAPTVHRYRDVMYWLVTARQAPYCRHPVLNPGWDNTPRSGRRGLVLAGSTPELFREQVRYAAELTAGVPLERNLLFVKSWNEWAEGNHLEPDLRWGRRYLEALRDEILAG